MVDYSKLSDFEINKLVARAIDGLYGDDRTAIDCYLESFHKDSSVRIPDGDIGWIHFNPCNNPADAWPIIVENKITVHSPMKYDEPQEWLAFDVNNSDVDFKDTNPLRAAMIVYLMMQDTKNG